MKKRIIVGSIIILLMGAIGFFFLNGSSNTKENALPKVKVQKGTLSDKALAVGTIEPENEISVKSKISGVVSHIYADVGTYVRAGQPLLEVKPDPTPIELADAKRQLQLMEVDFTNLTKDKSRQESLYKQALISAQEYEAFTKRYQEAELRVKLAREKLALLETGKVTIGDTEIESIIKAPIDGFVLTRAVEVGDPVTPLSSYQEGTVLMKMANMQRLLFKGSVDEIDVGKMREGMPAEIKIGALPSDTVHGTLRKIWLKAEKKDNATVFPIEIVINSGNKVTLRAGYSANANIIIKKKENILFLPERVITFRNDSAIVKVAVMDKELERVIKTGLSDAINVEIVSGLKEGDEVFEKPVKKID
jgi:HlyD family secretion protein